MRACNCPGVLAELTGRFQSRLVEWAGTPQKSRRGNVTVNTYCSACGKQWTMQFFCAKAKEARVSG